MKRLLNSITRYLANVPDQMQRRKVLVLVSVIGMTVLAIYGISKLQFDFTIEKWLKQDDAAFVAYDAFHEQFGSDDGVVIVYKPKDGDVFSVQSLRAVKGIRDELINYRSNLKEGDASPLDHVVKVDSLINAPVLTVKDDVLLSRWLVGKTVPTSQQARDDIRKTAESERDFPLKYFSKDMKYGAIYIKTDFGAIPMDSDEKSVKGATVKLSLDAPAGDSGTNKDGLRFKPTDMADYIGLHAALNKIVNKPEYANHLEYYKLGNTIDSENQIKMGEEMGRLYMAGIVVMLIVQVMIFRSFSGAVWPFLIIVLTTVWTLGISGLLGISASPFVVLTILLILTIGMADATHMMSGYVFCRHEGHDFKSAMRAAYEKSGLACMFTTVTTTLGISAMLYTDLLPVINFAIMCAIGVAGVFLMTIYLLPVLLDLWSPVPKVEKPRRNPLARLMERITPDFLPALQRWLEKIVPAVEKRPYVYIAPFLIIFAICVYGAFQVKVDYSIYDQYAEGSNFRQGIELMDEKMAGSSRMSLYVDVGEDNGFQDPAVLRVIEDLQRKLERDYSKYVVTTSSIVDVVKDAYQKQNEGRPDAYVIPAKRETLSQTLFTFNMADPDLRGQLVSENYQKANVTVTLRSYGSYEYTDVFERMKKDINASLALIKQQYPKASVSITGLFAMGMTAAEYLVMNELQSFGLSLLMISLVLLIIFSSFKAGLISLIPNLIPSLLVLGLLGLLGTPLDFYTMMLAPIVVGIALDDTIHFVTVYRSEVIKDGDIRRALTDTVKECGQSIVFASMILGFGFGIMAIATTPGLHNLGKFGFIAIFSGLICELFLTPALILVFKLRFRPKEKAVSVLAKTVVS